MAQPADVGRQPYRNFTHRDYVGHIQNWAIVQDHRGVMYAGNNNGVLEYDGNTWKTIPINGNIARCLDVDEYGRVWVGAQDDMGYLAADSTGNLFFKSLKGMVSCSGHEIGLTRQVCATPSGVYFSTNSCIVKINGNEVTHYSPKTYFHRTYSVSDKVFSVQPGVGLTVLKNDTLMLAPQGEFFENILIYAMVPFDEYTILIATQSDGFFLYNTQGLSDETVEYTSNFLTRFYTNDDSFFSENWVYCGVALNNNLFAFGTYRGGVALIDKKGQIVQRIGKAEGIQDETVWNITADNQDNLWMALNNGISYVAINSPITFWDKESGPQGVLQSVLTTQYGLYASTNAGVFLLEKGEFKRVEGILDLSWGITKVKSSDNREAILVGTGNGIYQIEGLNARLIKYGDVGAINIFQSKKFENHLFVGLYDGLGVIKYLNGQWVYVGKFSETTGRIWFVEEDGNGVWFVLRHKGVAKAFVNDIDKLQFDSLNVYTDFTHKLNFDEEDRLLNVAGKLRFSTTKGLYYFHMPSNSFKPDTSLGLQYTQGKLGINILRKDQLDYLWFESYEKAFERSLMRAKVIGDTSLMLLPAEFNEFPKMVFTDVNTTENGVAWIAGVDGLYQFNPMATSHKIRIPSILIRSVTSAGKVLFGGNVSRECPDGYFECISKATTISAKNTISYKDNSVGFTFASPFFGQQDNVKFSYQLVGFDSTWSEWVSAQSKEYTNLPYGKYAFRVKAMSVYDVESSVAEFRFEVEPPWYKSSGMYVVYVFLLLGLVMLVVAIKTRMLKATNMKLQRLVDERTHEISEQQKYIIQKNDVLSLQKEEIESQRDELDFRNQQTKASIEYALTIQKAILPSKSYIDRYFDSFILYRPKDVVSGDFYWFSKVKRSDGSVKLIFAVVDCTGHGVPGALMSMIGSRILSEIVEVRRIFDPAEILDTLSTMLNRVLSQKANQGFDSMDASICTFEQVTPQRYLVAFAGANRPLVYVSQGSQVLNVIRGNRKSIGGILPDIDKDFETHLIDLAIGDSIFMYTDGLSDQNNQLNKKFTTNRLHSIFSAHISESMEAMGGALEEEIMKFKGNEPQRDDITVVGLRLK